MDAEKMARFAIPADVRELHIFGDNDLNFAGQKAAFALAHRAAVHARRPQGPPPLHPRPARHRLGGLSPSGASRMNDNDDLFSRMDAPTTQELAVDGMNRAVDHADRVEPGWSDQAYEMMEGYALSHFEFMTEEVRVWAYGEGLPQPPDGRAWGAVTSRAVKAGMIALNRYRKTRIPPAHATPRAVWRSILYQGSEAA
jgi:hypothetical protein